MRKWAVLIGGSLFWASIAGCIGRLGEADSPLIAIWEANGSSVGNSPTGPQDPSNPTPVAAASTGSFSALATAVASTDSMPEMVEAIAVETNPPANDDPADNPAMASSVVDPLEAVDLTVLAMVDVLTAADPLRSLFGAPLDFALMPQIGIAGECPAVAFVATEDSAAWALAIDFNYRHSPLNQSAPAALCRDAADGSRELAGVLGLLHRRGEALTELITENYAIDGAPTQLSGDCEITGADGTPIVADGTVSISVGDSHASGAVRIEIANADSLAVGGSAVQVRNADFGVACDLVGLRVRPVVNGGFVPEAGSLGFTLSAGPTMVVTFDALSVSSGIVQVSIDGADAQPHVVTGLVGAP